MKVGQMGLDQSLFIVFFVYGLAFFGMGLAMAMEAGRPSALADGHVLRPLAGFGLIHGAHEWLDAYLLQAQALGLALPNWVEWLPLVLLTSSYLSLLVFALTSLRLVTQPRPYLLQLAIALVSLYFLFTLLSVAFSWNKGGFGEEALEGLTRYVIAVPSSLLAAFGLHFIGVNSRTRSQSLEKFLNSASIGFGMYSLTHLFVSPMPMFPANILNKETFQSVIGFPIEIVWTCIAIWITFSLLRSLKESEQVRQADFLSAQKARLDALTQQQELRRELLRHTVRAQEEERARIARELHDETAQTLSAFTLELASLRNDKLRKPDVQKTVERLQTLSRDMSQGLYRLVHDLRPAQLDDLGLVPALRFLIEQECRPLGLRVGFEVEGSPRRLDPLVETVLFRVGQEALVNLSRHAQVQEGRVEIVYAEKDVTLRVSDRGRGFDPAENFHPPHGWGLAGMKERVESVGGILQIESAPGQGTMMEARVPLPAGGKEQA
jgi:signal transduction histidine kinase